MLESSILHVVVMVEDGKVAVCHHTMVLEDAIFGMITLSDFSIARQQVRSDKSTSPTEIQIRSNLPGWRQRP